MEREGEGREAEHGRRRRSVLACEDDLPHDGAVRIGRHAESTVFSMQLVFEEWENFLKDEIANRRKNQNFYLEEELWFILYSLVKVGLLYEGKNCKLGDLHPSNIIVTPQGFIRVITRDSFPLELTNFEKIVEEIKADVYLGIFASIQPRRRWIRR